MDQLVGSAYQLQIVDVYKLVKGKRNFLIHSIFKHFLVVQFIFLHCDDQYIHVQPAEHYTTVIQTSHRNLTVQSISQHCLVIQLLLRVYRPNIYAHEKLHVIHLPHW